MPSVIVEGLVILLLIIINGIFAMAEIAVVSARKSRLQQLAEAGDTKARAALELAKAPNQFLSTVQVGITLIGVLAGAFGGATIAKHLASWLGEFSPLAPYSHALSLALVVAVTTYLSLIVGELVPKRLALNNPERLAAAIAKPMRTLSKVANPVVHVLGLSTEFMLRILGMKPSTESSVTEEEIRALIEEGARAGMFEEAEREMVERVFRLGDRRVGAVMTPRTEIVWLDSEAPPEEIRDTIMGSAHSRFLVAQDSLDNVLGIVQAKDLLVHFLGQHAVDLTTILQQPLFVPETMGALKVLELFKQSGTHIALAIDEYGGIQGLVTPNDILEAIVGDLPAAGEGAEPLALQRDDGSWLLDGMLPVDEFKALFHLGPLPGEEQAVYHTLAGFVIMQLGRIPRAGDYFEWEGLKIEVVDMDGNRVDKVLVVPLQHTTSDTGPDLI